MRLDERSWVLPGGLTEDWKAVHGLRLTDAAAQARRIAARFAAEAPAGARARNYLAGLKGVLSKRTPLRDRFLSDPVTDYWLHLWDKHFACAAAPGDESNWHLQFGLFQGLAAALALAEGRSGAFDVMVDPGAHVHLYGGPYRLELPGDLALKSARLTLTRAHVQLSGPEGLAARFPRRFFCENARQELSSGPVKAVRAPEVIPGLRVEHCGLLAVQGVVMHGLAHPSPAELARFTEVLRVALAHVRERSPALYAEMTDLTRLLVPLVNPKEYGSVSSSYVNMRGTICLSHADDPLLQAETLIHEFCHQKMNQLLLADHLLLPGQGGQVFYSPWRPDARRLRGLILGAHAFLNVAHYLLRSLSREEYPLQEKIAVMGNIARRLFEVDSATRSVCGYASLSEFGARYMLLMARQTQSAFHAVQWFPPRLLKEAKQAHEAHRRKHGLPWTGIHRARGLRAAVHAAPFGQKRVLRRRLPELKA